MAELFPETTEIVNRLKQQSLDVLHKAKFAEYKLLELYGETDRTMPFFEELIGVAEEASTVFSRFNQIQLRVAESQPSASPDLLKLLSQVVDYTASRVPAWNRSIEEVKLECDLP